MSYVIPILMWHHVTLVCYDVKPQQFSSYANWLWRNCNVCCCWCILVDVLALATSINELTTHTRRSRTAMWCALQTSMKDVPASSLHHLRPSELAAHDAASHHGTAPPKECLTAPTQGEAVKPGTATMPLVSMTDKKADDNNNAQPADVMINSLGKAEVPQVK